MFSYLEVCKSAYQTVYKKNFHPCIKTCFYLMFHLHKLRGHVAQSVMCLAKDESLIADPGVVSSILAWSHSFVEIDHEIISTVILLPSTESLQSGCCQLQGKVCAQSTG